ncbi:Mut7-C RNAse domain-containing protein [Archaeoglobus veneficus]|uniref:Mut7-C RNAse domain-containing protein n=1 Tax=Archaeoglobus veneficus (strain DSM 11195 / SNP6) TaxID=693661 RepID=F2KRW8_ARCVS|nr:Mut7-C RNAse domain-containing protein [Archaeoglobus veneficus]AEA46809.1 protein of unknown function DUF82 [Archaeoglobus veneficus SNP6]
MRSEESGKGELKFICDRMLGKLATWLRIAGYDTLYVGSIEVDGNEDTYMVHNHKDRILLTKDRELYRRAISAGRRALLIKSNSVAGQMKEVMALGVKFEPVMNRCSVCNALLRKPTKEEAREVVEREKLGDDILERYELWYCEKCRKLYWMGSHWRNMLRFLEGLKSEN